MMASTRCGWLWAVAVMLVHAAVLSAQEPVARYDFGTSDSPVEAGYTQVTIATEYTAERGYGWDGTDGLMESDKQAGDALQRDFIYRYGGSTDLSRDFLVDLEPGRYCVVFFAGDQEYNRAGTPFDILLNGQTAVTQWRNAKWEFRVAEVTVTRAPLRITFRSSMVPDQRYPWWFCNGIIVYRGVTAEQTQALMDAEAERLKEGRYAEYEEVIPEPDPDETQITDADRERGYIAFARDYLQHVWPRTRPTERERTAELRCWATQGEYEPVSFAVVPLEDLGACAVAVGDLRSDDAVLPADCWDIRIAGLLRHRLGRDEKRFKWGPKILYPGARADITEGRTRWWWLTVKVPADQQPGFYTGSVVFTPKDAEPWSCPIRVRVLPFAIEKPPGEIFGMYYSTSYALYPQNRDKHFDDMREHLIDTITLSDRGPVGGWDEMGVLKLDFSVMDEYIKAAQAHGLTGPMPWDAVHRLPGMIPKDLPDDEWGARYKELIAATVAEGRKQGWPPILCYPVDEPGNDPQRVETAMKLMGLAREVPGALTYCTPNGIEGGLKLLPVIDYACWQHQSANAETLRATLEHGRTFWYYSSNYGADTAVARFRSGLLRWRLDAKGMFYWHYNAFVGDPYDDLDAARSDMFVSAPTPDGPLPTLGWECEREGIEDLCLLRMLEKRLAATPADKTPEARTLLEEMRSGIIQDGKQELSIPDGYTASTFHRYRQRVIDCILELR